MWRLDKVIFEGRGDVPSLAIVDEKEGESRLLYSSLPTVHKDGTMGKRKVSQTLRR
jgi:hypothetical protein